LASGSALAEMELMEMSCRRPGEQVLRPELHLIRVGEDRCHGHGQNAYWAGSLQPSNAVALKLSQRECWGRQLYRNQLANRMLGDKPAVGGSRRAFVKRAAVRAAPAASAGPVAPAPADALSSSYVADFLATSEGLALVNRRGLS